MEALSRETLENMMEQAVAHAPPSHSGRRVKPPEQKTAMRSLRQNPDIQEHLSMIVLSPVFAPRKLPFMPPKNLTA